MNASSDASLPGPARDGTAGEPRRTWTTRRAVVSHVALVVWVAGCSVATWWQIGIALSGDGLGWVYSVMWPCFALFGTIFWWYLLHDDPETVGRRGLRRLQHETSHAESLDTTRSDGSEDSIRRAEEEDPELAAYNAYLASLARGDRNRARRAR